MSASDLDTVRYATQGIVKGLVEAPDWQIIETYWNTVIQQNNIWSKECQARTWDIVKEVR